LNRSKKILKMSLDCLTNDTTNKTWWDENSLVGSHSYLLIIFDAMAAVIEASVEPVALHELVVSAGFGDGAVFYHEYDMGVSDRGQAMSNDDAGSADLRLVQSV
jgi:hypothetical protein